MEHKLTEIQAELKRYQKQLLQKQKLASIGQLTAGIMHEIQNPLNFVNNFSRISIDLIKDIDEIIDELGDSINIDAKDELLEITDTLKNNINKILQNSKRAESIVKGMLMQSRGKPGVFQLVDINKTIKEYVNLAYHGRRAENKDFNTSFNLDFDESIGKINVIPQDFSRVILNIINNSCDAIIERFLHEKNYSPCITVKTKKTNGFVKVQIHDNGTGMPEKVKEKIFEAFFSTKDEGKGTGLGLAMTYEIINGLHKGSVEVNTKENEYTEFIISIPTNLKN
ncbi:MAG: HAMP domain-containing histidine kinase [Bacteroidetes bacterium]|nr:HAMP domain-containing histidine kinase [Bacteroidota bacterium]